MTIFRFSFEKSDHGFAVSCARWLLRVGGLATTRGPLGKFIQANGDLTDKWVITWTLVSFSSVIVSAILPYTLLIILTLAGAWRLYDINLVHFHILIIDRTNTVDPGYKSAVRSFILSGMNLIEVVFWGFVIEVFLLKAGFVACLFDTADVARNELANTQRTFVAHLYNAADFSSISSACITTSLSFAFVVAFSFSMAFLVLVVVARVVSAIRFVSRADEQEPMQ